MSRAPEWRNSPAASEGQRPRLMQVRKGQRNSRECGRRGEWRTLRTVNAPVTPHALAGDLAGWQAARPACCRGLAAGGCLWSPCCNSMSRAPERRNCPE
jgi:hypothetical protein